MACDWSCSVREDELEQRVVEQWPHGYSPRVPDQGEQSRSSDRTGASHSPVIVRQICKDTTGSLGSLESQKGAWVSKVLGKCSHNHNLAEARIMGKKMCLLGEGRRL